MIFMTQAAVNNAEVLYRLGIGWSEAKTFREIYDLAPELKEVLESPVVSTEKKDAVIDRVFSVPGISKKMRDFTKVMCRLGYIGRMQEILEAFEHCWDRQNHILRAKLICAGEPEASQEDEARAILERDYPGAEVILERQVDEDLLGGFVLQVDHMEYDRSYEGRLHQLKRKLTGR